MNNLLIGAHDTLMVLMSDYNDVHTAFLFYFIRQKISDIFIFDLIRVKSKICLALDTKVSDLHRAVN